MKHMHNTSLWRSPWTFLQLLLALTTLAGGTLAAPQVLSGVDAYGYSNPLLTPAAPLTWKAIDLANDGYGASIGLLTDDSLLRIDQSPVLDPQRARGIHYRAVSAGAGHFLALRSNGSILAFGNNQAGQCNVPALPPGLIYKSVVARGELSGALRSDGQILLWGNGAQGQSTVPNLPSGVTWTMLDIGRTHCLGLRSDGQISGWGAGVAGSMVAPTLPAGTTYTSVHAGWDFSIAMRSDGELVSFGASLNIPGLPSGLTYIAVDVQDSNYLLVRSDGGVRDRTGWTAQNPVASARRYLSGVVRGTLDFYYEQRDVFWRLVDCDGNGVDDYIQTANGAGDCNGDKVPDSCNLLEGARDCDLNGVLDACQMQTSPDCNLNGSPDACDLAAGHSFDANGDFIPDECAFDCNANGVPDEVELMRGSLDCDSNGVPDYCDPDVNTDGVVDACQDGGSAYCFGAASTCPCGNNGAATSGCANSQSPTGASLTAEGLPSRLADSLRLVGRGMPAVSSVLYFQGTSPLTGTPYGDGLRCVNGLVIRLGYTFNSGGESVWPAPAAAPIHIGGAIPATGAVSRYYQAWYRDVNPGYCTPNRFNLTNGVSVAWVP